MADAAVDEIIRDGTISCGSHKFNVVNGVPRFVLSEGYNESFGFQWNKWPRVQFESENCRGVMRGHTADMFKRITELDDDMSLLGKVVTEIGCGPGRFIEQARQRGAMVIGIDYSLAVNAASVNFANDENVCIVQADAMALPIRSGSMDLAYSIGVLHHTPNAQKAFMEMSRTVSVGGQTSLCVYSQGGHYDRPEVNLWRRLFRLTMPLSGQIMPLAYSYIGGYVIYPISFIPVIGHAFRFLYPTVRLPDIRWRILDTFDSVTPCYQSRHSPFEIHAWFIKAGHEAVRPTNWGMTSMTGTKI